MKRMLPLLLIAPVLFLAQSCTKGVLYPEKQYLNITGTWYLSETMQSNGGGWTYFKTGLEKGVFKFFNSGNARYDDGYNIMTGYWNILELSDGYYDRHGNYRRELHNGFKMHVSDSYTNNSIDLYFDDIEVYGDNIIGTSYNGNTISRYIFSRY